MGSVFSAHSFRTGLRAGGAGAVGGAVGGAFVGAVGGGIGALAGLPIGGAIGFVSGFLTGVAISSRLEEKLNKLGISLEHLKEYIALLYNGPTEPSVAPIRPLVFFVLYFEYQLELISYIKNSCSCQ